MKHTYMTVNEYGMELKTIVTSPYSIVRTEIATPEELGREDGEFEATIWGLSRYVPTTAECGVYAMFGSFQRDGRHVRYSASVIFDGDEAIHDPFSEMLDDIEYLMAGQGTMM